MKLVLIHINHIVIVQDFLLVDLGLDDVFDPAFCAAHVVGGDKIGNAAVDKADTDENVCGCNGIKRIGTDERWLKEPAGTQATIFPALFF